MFTTDLLRNKRILITGGGTGLGKGMAAPLPRTRSHGPHLRPPRRSPRTNRRRTLSPNHRRRTHPRHPLRRPQPRRRRSHDRLHLERSPARHPRQQRRRKFHRPHRRTFSRRMELRHRHRAHGHAELHHGLRTPLARRQHKGTVLSISATYAPVGSAYVVPSAVSKAGVEALTRSLAVEWGNRGIRMNAIAPGPIPTQGAFSRVLPRPELETLALDRNPLHRFGTVEELANLAAFLVSDGSGYINGEVIRMDGGEFLQGAGEFSNLGRVLKEEDWQALKPKKSRSWAQKAPALLTQVSRLMKNREGHDFSRAAETPNAGASAPEVCFLRNLSAAESNLNGIHETQNSRHQFLIPARHGPSSAPGSDGPAACATAALPVSRSSPRGRVLHRIPANLGALSREASRQSRTRALRQSQRSLAASRPRNGRSLRNSRPLPLHRDHDGLRLRPRIPNDSLRSDRLRRNCDRQTTFPPSSSTPAKAAATSGTAPGCKESSTRRESWEKFAPPPTWTTKIPPSPQRPPWSRSRSSESSVSSVVVSLREPTSHPSPASQSPSTADSPGSTQSPPQTPPEIHAPEIPATTAPKPAPASAH